MARPREFDDRTVVLAVRDQFWEHGYASTSIADLQMATGLSRSSLYENYESKRALFTRALESYISEIIGPLFWPLESAVSPSTAIIDHFLRLANFEASVDPRIARRGCFIINTSHELNALDEEAERQVSDYRSRIRAAVLTGLIALPKTVEDTERKADLLTGLMMAIMVIARTNPDAAAALAFSVAEEISSW